MDARCQVGMLAALHWLRWSALASGLLWRLCCSDGRSTRAVCHRQRPTAARVAPVRQRALWCSTGEISRPPPKCTRRRSPAESALSTDPRHRIRWGPSSMSAATAAATGGPPAHAPAPGIEASQRFDLGPAPHPLARHATHPAPGPCHGPVAAWGRGGGGNSRPHAAVSCSTAPHSQG